MPMGSNVGEAALVVAEWCLEPRDAKDEGQTYGEESPAPKAGTRELTGG